MPTVLDIGCGPPAIALPAHYAGWKRVRLDIDPACRPDIVMDARELTSLPGGSYDAAYCSHNLEHFHRHDGLRMLCGMRHVITPNGFAEIRVPNLDAVFQMVVQQKLDIDDVLYESDLGPIRVRDVIYGYEPEIQRSGHDLYAHKTGFTRLSLHRFLEPAGFFKIAITCFDIYELTAFAFAQNPDPALARLLALPESICN